MIDHSKVHFPNTRGEALKHLESFIPAAGRYSSKRNFVLQGHENVSRLSAAVRHRLVLETEVAEAPLERYAPSTVQKFTQEVYWRCYWKSWLSLRPQVWTDYLRDLSDMRGTEDEERAKRIEEGGAGLPIMAHFAEELKKAGYLHNHARMWFAAWWVHTEKLPWQLGADFFFRHLIDGDPASNTLSWRWVAGWQTPGKTYLARKSNIAKYLDPGLFDELSEGLEVLVAPKAAELPNNIERPPITRKELPDFPYHSQLKTGIWLHEEDLLPEDSPLEVESQPILLTPDSATWNNYNFSSRVQQWKMTAVEDCTDRCREKFSNSDITLAKGSDSLAVKICQWAQESDLKQVVALRPEVGIIDDQIEQIQSALSDAGVHFALVDRPFDQTLRPLATAGFFGFWKKVEKRLKEAEGF